MVGNTNTCVSAAAFVGRKVGDRFETGAADGGGGRKVGERLEAELLLEGADDIQYLAENWTSGDRLCA